MKSLKIIILLVAFSFSSIESSAQSVEGFTHHDTDGNVSLYYKVGTYGVTFRAINKRAEYVYVRINNVKSTWTDGKTRRKTVNIGFVKSGGASNGGGLNLDNYAKMKTWKFDSWEWSTKSFNN